MATNMVSRWGLAALVAAYVVVATGALAALLWDGLSSAQRDSLRSVLETQIPAIAVGCGLILVGLVALVAKLIARYTVPARRLTAEVRLLLEANPDHRLDRSGPPEFTELAAQVDALAERRRLAEQQVSERIAEAQQGLEQERNRLAALMAELAVAVVVCNVDGRILLYNEAARSLVDDDTVVGLGRSVFGIVDRDLLEHARTQLQAQLQAASTPSATSSSSPNSYRATTLLGGRLLQVQVATVLGADRDVSGFVLLLDDLTERMTGEGRRDELLRGFTEATRASLGSIQAAIETVLDFPEMDAEDRTRFAGIVREETHRLGGRLESWAAESETYLATQWLLSEVKGGDLLRIVAESVSRVAGVTVSATPTASPLWVKADTRAVTQAAVHLVGLLQTELDVETVTLTLTSAGGYAQLELTWVGPAPTQSDFQAWLTRPLSGGAAPTVREVVTRHGGELWLGGGSGEPPHLRLLLPLTSGVEAVEAVEAVATVAPGGQGDRVPVGVSSRPEFYDFALFEHEDGTEPGLSSGSYAWHDRALDALVYTVFDTETTGLQALQGDEIISIGAVRVVNGRLLRQESFERLVDPQRSVPPVSTSIHGITRDMLRGKPTLDVVLPEFARYAADTVLVGHNVSFDLQFLRLKEESTGVRFGQPVLDTLLLDAAIHPDHDDHSLEAIAARLGVDVVGRHTALGDALVTGAVFLRLISLLQQRGIRRLGEAMEESRATMQARIDRSMYK